MPSHVRIEDSGIGPGVPLAAVILPTVDIPPRCSCVWSVSLAAPGRACQSTLRRQNASCPELRAHRAMALAALAAGTEVP